VADEEKNPENPGCICQALTVWILPFDFAQGRLCIAPQNDTFLLGWTVTKMPSVLQDAFL